MRFSTKKNKLLSIFTFKYLNILRLIPFDTSICLQICFVGVPFGEITYFEAAVTEKSLKKVMIHQVLTFAYLFEKRRKNHTSDSFPLKVVVIL